MYDFRDLQPRAEPSSSLPLEAICYAGKWLDREIPEFETLVVEGRGGFERQINAPERVGDGSLYLNSRIKERKITVTFRLLCNTIERYNEVLAKLNDVRKPYLILGDNGEPLIEDNNVKFKDEEAREKATAEIIELFDEKAVIDITEYHDKLHALYDALNEYEYDLSGDDANAYDLLLDELEKIKEDK